MKSIRMMALVAISLLVITSCSKEDDDSPAVSNPNKGTLTINTDETELGHGEIVKYQKIIEGLYRAPVYLMGSTFNMGTQTINGTGHGVELTVFTSGADNITPGTYNINNDISSLGSFQMTVFTDWELGSDVVSAIYVVTSGKLKVSKSGAVYSVDISVKADKYDITNANTAPSGSPSETDVAISALFRGDLNQKYFN